MILEVVKKMEVKHLSEILKDSFYLPLVTIGGEQSKGAIEPPIDSFSLTTDKDFLKQIEDDERDDKYIYAYTDSGVSENGRDWKPEHMESMAKQVIEKLPVGYLGHIKPKDYGFEFPDPQIVWFGSYTETLKNKSTRLWIKGYVLPTAEKLQKWIKLKAVDTISVYGKISYQMKGEIMDIKDIDLKSIDIARKLGEGLNSGIVGLYGEMAETYEEVRDILQKSCRDYFKENAYDLGLVKQHLVNADTDSMNKHNDEPYIYCYIKKMYHKKDIAIVSVEVGYPNIKLFEVSYDVDSDSNDVTIKSATEVEEKVSYTKKKTSEPEKTKEVGEMFDNKEENQMGVTAIDLSKVTVDDIRGNTSLYNAMKTAIAQEMSDENENKILVAKAGEMDKIIGIVGEQEDYGKAIESIVRFNAKFVGEMADAAGVDDSATPEEIINTVKEQKATLDTVKDTVGVEENEDLVDAVEEVVEANNEALAQNALSEVSSALEEALKKVDNETIAEYVKDDFSDLVEADLSDVADIEDWKEKALALIDEEFDNVVDKHTKKLSKVIKNSKAVGEMNAYGELGMGSSMNPNQQVDNSVDDDDIASAKALGYGDL